ncbi:MAG: putative urea ABC transporter substrate-binding protein [Pseudomonadota bacterium]|nr:putative urea ABC transporter substrate-binding protein [Pseudomonadota bacterium]
MRIKTLGKFIAAAVLACGCVGNAQAEAKKEFDIAWSIYVGWMPWPYADEAGIVKKWADKYGIKIKITQINDYVESVNQYTSGKFDGVTVTNMDALTIPAAGGVDTTALIVGDYSNGNDGIVLKNAKTLSAIKGQKINLVELSVSHYLLARGLDTLGLAEKDVKVVNTSDADMIAAFQAADTTAAVTWNPQLAEIKAAPGASLVFDSSKIPGEIIDTLVVNTQTLKDNPALGKALVGIWFDTMKALQDTGATGKAAREAMAKLSGSTLASFEDQLKTTKMFYTPAEAVAFTTDAKLVKTMDLVRSFSYDHGLLGADAPNKDFVGIAFPSGTVLGNPKSVKLRFDASYMKLAADGKL